MAIEIFLIVSRDKKRQKLHCLCKQASKHPFLYYGRQPYVCFLCVVCLAHMCRQASQSLTNASHVHQCQSENKGAKTKEYSTHKFLPVVSSSLWPCYFLQLVQFVKKITQIRPIWSPWTRRPLDMIYLGRNRGGTSWQTSAVRISFAEKRAGKLTENERGKYAWNCAVNARGNFAEKNCGKFNRGYFVLETSSFLLFAAIWTEKL
jgi:hypothetical protein